MAYQHPDLARFRARVEESSDSHKTAIAPRDRYDANGRIIINTQGMNSEDKQRIVQEEAAKIRRAMGGS